MRITLIDVIIPLVYLTAVAIGGLMCERLVKGSIAHFLVAGRKIRKFLLASAGSAAEVGLIAVMFIAEEAYTRGLSALMLPVMALYGQVIVGFTGFCVERYRQTGAVTMGHYAEMRYGRSFRIFSGSFQFIAILLTIAMFPIAAGTFLTYLLDLPASFQFLGLTVPTVPVVTAALVAPVIGYTIAGGTISVAFTDYAQFAIAWVSMAVVTVVVLMNCSWGKIMSTVHQTFGALGVNPFLHQGAKGYGIFWIGWMLCQYIWGNLVWPPINLRIASSKEPKAARQMFMITAGLMPGRQGMIILWGLAALVMVPTAAISVKYLPAGWEQLVRMPYYLGTIMPPVVVGLFLAGMIAAEMSNVSAYFMASSAIATQDIIFPAVRGKELSSKAKVTINRLVLLCLAVFAYIFGLMYGLNQTLFTYLMMSAAVYTPGAGAFLTFGLYSKRANVVGAFAGMMAGGILPMLCIVLKFENPNTQFMLAFLSYIAAFVAMILGTLVGERFGVKPLHLVTDSGGRK